MTVVEKVKFEVVANNAKPDDTPAWQSSKSYSPDDRVLFEGKIYVCAVANTNKKPGISINEWSEMGNPNPTKSPGPLRRRPAPPRAEPGARPARRPDVERIPASCRHQCSALFCTLRGL